MRTQCLACETLVGVYPVVLRPSDSGPDRETYLCSPCIDKTHAAANVTERGPYPYRVSGRLQKEIGDGTLRLDSAIGVPPRYIFQVAELSPYGLSRVSSIDFMVLRFERAWRRLDGTAIFDLIRHAPIPRQAIREELREGRIITLYESPRRCVAGRIGPEDAMDSVRLRIGTCIYEERKEIDPEERGGGKAWECLTAWVTFES